MPVVCRVGTVLRQDYVLRSSSNGITYSGRLNRGLVVRCSTHRSHFLTRSISSNSLVTKPMHNIKHTSSKPIGRKLVYKTKRFPDGTLRYKARLVVKGYEQVKGVDFGEAYAPAGKLITLHYLLSFMAYNS